MFIIEIRYCLFQWINISIYFFDIDNFKNFLNFFNQIKFLQYSRYIITDVFFQRQLLLCSQGVKCSYVKKDKKMKQEDKLLKNFLTKIQFEWRVEPLYV